MNSADDHPRRTAGVIRINVAIFLSLLSASLCPRAVGGLSGENVIIVVNADSKASRTIANHYAHLRQVPSCNVIVLSDIPAELKISLEDFKSKILLPVLEQIDSRGLAAQTRVVAYSADFPTAVGIAVHTARLTDPALKKYQRPTASISGLTFLYQFLLADNERYLQWGSNLYSRRPFPRHFVNPFIQGKPFEQFEAAQSRVKEQKYADAGDLFEKLLEQYPTLPSLAILAAENRARGGDQLAARRLIGDAIAAGWNSGRYLRQSETLSPLVTDPSIAAAVAALDDAPIDFQEPLGFVADVGWTKNGSTLADGQQSIRYLLSCCLAVIHPRGSDVDQAVDVLRRSSASDSTFPNAQFWFTRTTDIRTTTRFPVVGDALAYLRHLGCDADIAHSVMPINSRDCVGLMLGTATMPLNDRKWKFVPGAISENLTSLSAAFDSRSQSKITELLHAGAAISSGPVAEPYSIPSKFPSPMMYGYYASGTTALEAFYLSVDSPYQLLIVGDPLAQPFSRPPSDWVAASASASASAEQRSTVRVSRRTIPSASGPPPAIAMELYFEGRLARRMRPTDSIELALPESVSGAVQWSTIMIGSTPQRPQRSWPQWIEFGDRSEIPIITADKDGKSVAIECDGADSIELRWFGETIGAIEGDDGTVAISRERLGDGPLRLRPRAHFGQRTVDGKEFILPP